MANRARAGTVKTSSRAKRIQTAFMERQRRDIHQFLMVAVCVGASSNSCYGRRGPDDGQRRASQVLVGSRVAGFKVSIRSAGAEQSCRRHGRARQIWVVSAAEGPASRGHGRVMGGETVGPGASAGRRRPSPAADASKLLHVVSASPSNHIVAAPLEQFGLSERAANHYRHHIPRCWHAKPWRVHCGPCSFSNNCRSCPASSTSASVQSSLVMRLASRLSALPFRQARAFTSMAQMRDGKPYLSHLERTAAEPREIGLHPVTLAGIDQVNDNIRLLQLDFHDAQNGVSFQAGQWLDVFVPDPLVKKPGGFTVTSPPASALPNSRNKKPPHIELAVQYSPRNPPAAWLWQPSSQILGKSLHIRFGGSFIWPPANRTQLPKKVVMVAGGVGIKYVDPPPEPSDNQADAAIVR